MRNSDPKQLAVYVTQWSDQHAPGDPGHCAPNAAIWEVQEAFPLALFGPIERWVEWFAGECGLWAEEGEPNRFDSMKSGEIREPIVLLMRNGVAHVWDGSHRIAASLVAGKATIRAIVGVPD
jgi:hypothetical protein